MGKEIFTLQESIGYHFNFAFITTKKLVETKIKPFNLTHLQFSILMNLYKNNVTTQKELLNYSYGDEASITRLIDRLESKNYLKRVPCDKDKRKKRIVLTPSGIELTEKLILIANEVNQELMYKLNEKEQQHLLKLFQKMHT